MVLLQMCHYIFIQMIKLLNYRLYTLSCQLPFFPVTKKIYQGLLVLHKQT